MRERGNLLYIVSLEKESNKLIRFSNKEVYNYPLKSPLQTAGKYVNLDLLVLQKAFNKDH